ncbi:hypothetical protein [Dactylosporangium sp. NPDC051484]|uniref:hypothetical protein n=1 Tax=Dactylosporangium sp. NPDC051484 TaxID=3154942 RepID=UPI00344D95B0
MTKVLRLIGYWDGRTAPEGLPDVCDFVSAVDSAVQRAVAAYLRSGAVFAVAAGVSVCRLCGAANGSAEQTDGEHFVWPEGLAHYVEEHGVCLPDEVVAIAARGVAPVADLAWFTRSLLETGGATIDVEWWRHQAGPGSAGHAVKHLHGCRHSAMVASWDLPTHADIYVDRVPHNAVTILVKLRRLLDTAWPFSDLRNLLGSQPFHAAAGNPSRLYRTLATSPELRPFLFYDGDGGLMPVWSDT